MDENIQNKLPDQIVYQANPLIEARKRFNLIGTRIFYLGLKYLKPHLPHGVYYDDSDIFPTSIIPTEDLIKEFGGNKGYYSVLRDACKELIRTSVNVRDDNDRQEWVEKTVFSQVALMPNKGGLILQFNPMMRPYLIELHNKPFTKLSLQRIFELDSVFSVRLLELFLQYRNMAPDCAGVISRDISLDNLRIYMDLKKSAYEGRISNFRKNVLDIPIQKITAVTDISVNYTPLKSKRKVTGFHFEIIFPENKLHDIPEQNLLEEILPPETSKPQRKSDLSNEEDDIYYAYVNEGVHHAVVLKYIRKHGADYLRKALPYYLQRMKYAGISHSDKKRRGKWLGSALKGNYYGEYLIMKQAKNQEELSRQGKRDWEREMRGIMTEKQKKEILERVQAYAKEHKLSKEETLIMYQAQLELNEKK